MIARLVSVQIQFEIMADDGTLQHVNVKPIIVPAAQIDAIPQGIRDVLAQVQQQLDAQPTNATAPGD